MNTVERHLQPFRARLRLRRAFDLSALGLVIGFAAAAVVVLGARLAGLPASPYLLLLPVAALVIAIATALLRRPTTWDAAAAADSLGLAERVTSALHAARVAHPAASLVEAQALDGLGRVDPAAIRVRPNARRLRTVALSAAALVLVALAPLPELGDGAARAADRTAIDDARAQIDEVAAQIEPIAPEPAVRRVTEELDALDEALTQAKDLETAAQTIERSQERIASIAGGEQFAARRTLDALAAAWAGDPHLGQLGQALRDRDADAIDAAVRAIEGALANLDDEADRHDLQLDLQAAANLARDVPDLARALREAAVATGDDEQSRGLGGVLAAALGDAAGAAGSLGAVEAALAGLNQARAGLGAVGALAAGPAHGTGSGGAGALGAGGRGSDAGGSGGGSEGESGGGGGRGGENAGHGDTGGGGGGDGGSGATSGSAGGGTDSGGGAGTAGLAPGTPGGADASGSGGAGAQGEANMTGALTYESIYAPSLLGGDAGITGRTPGAASGAEGQTVDLPESPLTLGALRPYNEVYGDYEASARQALARSPLPPNLEALVQAYFGAIRPSDR